MFEHQFSMLFKIRTFYYQEKIIALLNSEFFHILKNNPLKVNNIIPITRKLIKNKCNI